MRGLLKQVLTLLLSVVCVLLGAIAKGPDLTPSLRMTLVMVPDSLYLLLVYRAVPNGNRCGRESFITPSIHKLSQGNKPEKRVSPPLWLID